MFKTLYARLALILSALVFALGIFFTWLSVFTSQGYFQEVSQRLNVELAAHLVDEWNLLQNGEVNRAHLEDVFHTLMVANPSIECYLLDNDGNLLGYKAPEDKIRRRAVDMGPVREFIDKGGRAPLLGDDPRSASRRKVFSAAPITIGDRQEGYLYVILGGEDYDSVADLLQRSWIASLSLWVGLSCIVVVLAVGLLSFALLTRRLRRLTRAVTAFRRSDFNETPHLPVHRTPERGDEIDQLSFVFEEMAGRIIRHIADLKRIDTERRELVGSVSHDLRAPLTTLQGHLETLLYKEQNLQPEERKEFLGIAIRNCHRLGRMIEELFELARLDTVGPSIERESFPLDELAHDVIQKYAVLADRRGVTLTNEIGAGPWFLSGDIGLIERALDNLIGNALTYTPAGGRVTLALEREGDATIVRVADTGIGIGPEDLPHIFDRFFRAGGKVSGTDGAGLGLAITRRIVELHGGTITVDSSPGTGATFTITFPAA